TQLSSRSGSTMASARNDGPTTAIPTPCGRSSGLISAISTSTPLRPSTVAAHSPAGPPPTISTLRTAVMSLHPLCRYKITRNARASCSFAASAREMDEEVGGYLDRLRQGPHDPAVYLLLI